MIKSVELQNFRNHTRTKIELGAGVNVLVGDNAQGKTNLLEAIYMTCVGRGFRSPRDREIIRFGQDFAKVNTITDKKFGRISVEITISTAPGKSGKQIKINDIPIAKMGELMGSVTCVFFNPDELKLVKESPADRRRFMDIGISQMDKVYFYNLLRYNKILKQRNAMLKSMRATPDELRALEIWDDQLAKYGTEIIKRRKQFCEELRSHVIGVHGDLAPTEKLSLEYETFAEMFHVEHFVNALRTARDKDLHLRTTTIGPHRDDIAMVLDGRDVRSFASQGQQRTVALSMKIAELKIFECVTGEKPILLLDDVLSELDENRQSKLFELIKGWQSVITTTMFQPKDSPQLLFKDRAVLSNDASARRQMEQFPAKIFTVKDGRIV